MYILRKILGDIDNYIGVQDDFCPSVMSLFREAFRYVSTVNDVRGGKRSAQLMYCNSEEACVLATITNDVLYDRLMNEVFDLRVLRKAGFIFRQYTINLLTNEIDSQKYILCGGARNRANKTILTLGTCLFYHESVVFSKDKKKSHIRKQCDYNRITEIITNDKVMYRFDGAWFYDSRGNKLFSPFELMYATEKDILRKREYKPKTI